MALRSHSPSKAVGGVSFLHTQVRAAVNSFESYFNFKRLAYPTTYR